MDERENDIFADLTEKIFYAMARAFIGMYL